jgi:hypothetical protein
MRKLLRLDKSFLQRGTMVAVIALRMRVQRLNSVVCSPAAARTRHVFGPITSQKWCMTEVICTQCSRSFVLHNTRILHKDISSLGRMLCWVSSISTTLSSPVLGSLEANNAASHCLRFAQSTIYLVLMQDLKTSTPGCMT